MGIVLRDEKGELVMATSEVENEVNDPESIELLAILRGLIFVQIWVYRN